MRAGRYLRAPAGTFENENSRAARYRRLSSAKRKDANGVCNENQAAAQHGRRSKQNRTPIPEPLSSEQPQRMDSTAAENQQPAVVRLGEHSTRSAHSKLNRSMCRVQQAHSNSSRLHSNLAGMSTHRNRRTRQRKGRPVLAAGCTARRPATL